jgi:hypothetical protein
MGIMRNRLTSEDIRHQNEGFYKNSPETYSAYVQRDMILEPARQMQLADLTDRELMDYLMNRNTSKKLDIYPEYASSSMKKFSEEILEIMRNLYETECEDLPGLREKLGNKAKMIALSDCGVLYTQIPRKNDFLMMTGKLEYKVEKATPVEGPRFFATTTGGFYGFLKFYEEEIGLIAPEKANSYLLGTGWCVDVEDRMVSSPIIAGEYQDIGFLGVKDGIYHVVPIKFFNVEADKSQKYSKRTRVLERDLEGNPIRMVTDIVRRK